MGLKISAYVLTRPLRKQRRELRKQIRRTKRDLNRYRKLRDESWVGSYRKECAVLSSELNNLNQKYDKVTRGIIKITQNRKRRSQK